jgi:two-component system chemotaxis sensor kinase CheA
MMSDKSLLQDFITETGEHLEETERNLLRMKQQPDDVDTLNTIFRSVHTIKGSSEYLGLEGIATLSHQLESLLEELRRKELSAESAIIDLLMGCNDRISVLVCELEQHQEEKSTVDDLVMRLKEASVQDTGTGTEETVDGYGDDEPDEELFGIFSEQLKDGIIGLRRDAKQLNGGEDSLGVLEQVSDRLSTLQSSSNYMGYDALKGLYEDWSKEVDDTISSVIAEHEVDFERFVQDTMYANMTRVEEMFPKISFDSDEDDTQELLEFSDEDDTQGLLLFDEETYAEDNTQDSAQETDNSLLNDFIDESGEHLIETERNLLHLEQQPDDIETLNKIFRSIHTIKGSSEYLGLENIAKLSHTLESLLDMLRRKERTIDEAVIDLLMDCCDRIGVLINTLSDPKKEQSSIDDLMLRLQEIMELSEPAHDDHNEDSIGEDEHDEELFGIFIEQLKEGLTGLSQDIQQMQCDDAVVPVLEQSADRLVALRSSSNYMGYDFLKGIYDKWAQDVDHIIALLNSGKQVDLELFIHESMLENIDKVKLLFPKVTFETVPGVGETDPSIDEPVAKPVDEGSHGADRGLLAEFITETGEHLEETERNLLKLEQKPDDIELLQEIFRSVHTIKGSSEYLGMERIAKLAHKLESLLDLMRRGERSTDSSVIDLLMGCNDRIGEMVSALDSDSDVHLVVDDLLEKLEYLLADSDAPMELKQAEQKLVIKDDTGTLYVEEYDKELFAIFMEQFSTGVKFLSDEIEQLRNENFVEDALVRCIERLSLLRSSANYMEYEELLELYDVWLKRFDELFADYKEGKSVDIESFVNEVMVVNLDKAKNFFSAFRSADTDIEDELGKVAAELPGDTQTSTDLKYEAPSDSKEAAPESAVSESIDDTDFETKQAASESMDDNNLDSMDAVHEAKNRSEFDSKQAVFDPEDDTEFDSKQAAHDSKDEADSKLQTLTLDDLQNSRTIVKLETLTTSDEENILLDKLAEAFESRLGLSDSVVKQYFNEDIENNLFSDNVPENLTSDDPAFESDGNKASDYDVVDVKNVESLLFSSMGTGSPKKQSKLPKPVTTDPPQIPERRAAPKRDGELSRPRHKIGRRQSDRFRDRMIKQSIRVDASKIDELMNQVGELVVHRSGFNELSYEMRELQLMLKQSHKLDSKEMQAFKTIANKINEATTSLGRVTSDLQENVMKVRMLPIAQLFSRYPRVVHELVRGTNKKVNLEIYGEETELDKKVIEQLTDPLIHIIRNAVDHGIEDEAVRRQKGKNETGTIRMEAYPESNYVVIEIRDDGKGIDAERIKTRAMEKELITPEQAAQLTDEQILQFIMQPGFSTAKEVTHTSGRGVGMDVVKDNIEKINGTIDIFSAAGTGSRFVIKIPLTLAIIPALLVRVVNEIFTIPLSTVDETIRVHKKEISTIEGLEVYDLRGDTIPLVRLKDALNMGAVDVDQDEQFVVIVNTGANQVGFIVDELKSRQEVVIKPLEDYLQEKNGFSGATILGDGSISLIIDVFEMVQISLDQKVARAKAATL